MNHNRAILRDTVSCAPVANWQPEAWTETKPARFSPAGFLLFQPRKHQEAELARQGQMVR